MTVQALTDAILDRLPEARAILAGQPGHRYGDFIAFLDTFGFPRTEERLRAIANGLDAAVEVQP